MIFRCLLFVGILYFFSTLNLSAQNTTISGYVKSGVTGEALIGAVVSVPELGKGTYTNTYGYYTLSLSAEQDSVEVTYSYLGYAKSKRMVALRGESRLDIELIEAQTTLNEVEIVANSYTEQVASTQMSVTQISMEEAKMIPALFGEVDIIKTLQLKPGVSSGSEGSSGIYVRGGGADQNLVLLDGTQLYNPNHLFGFFSTFNTDAVKDVKLYKGGFPAQYGGRLSSVIDVSMLEGNRKKFSAKGGLGAISSRLTVEGPIAKDKASFLISGRRTYVDVFTRLANQINEGNEGFNPIPDYFFYDLNAKVNVDLDQKNQLFLSGYLGRDRFRFTNDNFGFRFGWGNANATLRWNHLINSKMFVNTSVFVTDYNYAIENQFDIFNFELSSQITDYGGRVQFTWQPNDKHTIRYGGKATQHRFVVGRFNAGSADSSFAFNAGNTYFAQSYGLYVADEIDLSTKLSVNLGLHWSAFTSDGQFYQGLEPRFAANYLVSDRFSFKVSYARMFQYQHLVSSSGASLPTDVWYPSNGRVRPQSSHQVAAGISTALGESFLFTVELYYKWLQNQVDFRDAANLFVNDNLDREFVFGRGYSYGGEIYLEKNKGRLTGWVGYTLSWAWRVFDGRDDNGVVIPENAINDGNPFPASYDFRHDLTLVGIYQINRRLSVSATWQFRSGNPVSLATGRATFLGSEGSRPIQVPIFTERNGFRMPEYHRLDIGLVLKFFPKWGDADLTFSVYNAYNRRNAYFIYYEPLTNAEEVTTGFEARQVALFPIIPSITFNFKI